jgi:hypothetical protein
VTAGSKAVAQAVDVDVEKGADVEQAPGERAERDIDRFVDSRIKSGEAERQGQSREDLWAASVRRYNEANRQAVLKDRLEGAKAMHRSHAVAFGYLVGKWDREIAKLEAALAGEETGRQ